MNPTSEDLAALADVLNMDISEDDFEFSEELNNSEELVFDTTDSPKKEKRTTSVADTRDYSSITEPHWLIEKEDIQRILDTLNNVIIKSAEVVNKSVFVYRSFNKLFFNFNSNDIQGQFELTLSNLENMIDENKKYILEYSKLVTAVKNSDSKVVLKDKSESNTLVVELLGAEIELENYLGVDENLYQSINKIDTNSLTRKEISYSVLFNFLKNVSYTDKLSMRPDDRKVRVQGQDGYSNYALAIVNYKNVNLDDISLRLIDVSFLLKILNMSKSDVVFASNESNNFVLGDTFKIMLPRVNTDDLKYVKRICSDLKITNEFTMESFQFYKKLNMIRQFTGNSVTSSIYTENNSLWVLSKTTNQRDVKFKIAENLDETIKIDVKLPLMTLMNTYRLFKDYNTITVSVTDNQRFVFGVDDFSIIFGNLT